MADAMRSAVVESLRDGGRTVRLARVHGAVDVVVEDELEGLLVVLGGIAVLGAGEVEAQDPAALVGDR